jgi:hypothetical protein
MQLSRGSTKVVAVRIYLVVANQTLPGAELRQEIRRRAKQGPSSFHVLVPNTRPQDLTGDLGRASVDAASESRTAMDPEGSPSQREESTVQAQRRLDQLLDDLHHLQVGATGELGDRDPLKAVAQVLERRTVDEILLFTLPKPMSRWLGMDLPRRLYRRFKLPVTTITTKGRGRRRRRADV